MIVDFHTHVFPPDVRDNRDRYLALNPTFAELYSRHDAKLATADDLLRSMDDARIDLSVVLNFAWRDPDLCRRTNDYILESAAANPDRLIPFCIFAPGDGAKDEIERCVALGARGLGELRPESQAYHLDDHDGPADLLAHTAVTHDLILLFHATEPAGRHYPGKQGGPLDPLYRFIERSPKVAVVAAHWGGGLPFYNLLRSTGHAFANTYFDTAASRYLYRPEVFRHAANLVGAEHVLFGSDFPLLSQARCVEEVEEAELDDKERQLVLGENARRLLALP